MLLAALVACSASGTVECVDNGNCDRFVGGICQENSTGNSWCSYPDPGCPSGYRFSELDVGDGVSGLCVNDPTPDAPIAIDALVPDGSIDASGSCAKGTISDIQGNHMHVMNVSSADVAAGVERTYDIQGSAPHSHSATVTSSDFGDLQVEIPVTILSTMSGGHAHSITISCL
jgi:hypothetical protein